MKQVELGRVSRRLFTIAGLSAGAALLAPHALCAEDLKSVSGNMGLEDLPSTKPGTNASFPPLKQVDAGVLNIGYAEAGPSNGPVVILLHGWPHDIHSFVDVAPLLASKGYRVIVPFRISVDMAPRAFSLRRRRATPSRLRSRSTSSTLWMPQDRRGNCRRI